MGRLFCLVFVCLLLPGCDKSAGEQRLADYAARMARVLDANIAYDPDALATSRFPRPKALRSQQLKISIDLIDYLSLGGCELQKVVARANGPLGKVAQPSTKLVIHLDFLRLAPACVGRLGASGDRALAEAIQNAADTKREQLASVIWEAILGSSEYREFWRRPNNLLGYPTQINNQADTALVSLRHNATRWLGGDFIVDIIAFENDLKQLSFGDGGALLKSLDLQQGTLTAVDGAITKHFADQPFCRHKKEPRGQILDNVVRNYFIAEIQTWSARLEARRVKLMPKVDALEELLALQEPAAFGQWRLLRNERLAYAAVAPKRHVTHLLPLLEQCGRAPGSSASDASSAH